MGKPKQQVLSRFFSPKPKPAPGPRSAAPDPPPPPPPPPPPNPKPSAARPPVSTVASFSPAKRARALSLSPKSPAAKRPNPTPPPSRDAVRRRLLEPLHPEPPRPLNGGGGKGYTPLEQQVVDLKARHPDVLLMVEVGYRFRFFGEDAAVAAAVLGIVAHPDRSFLTASVPTFRLGFHVRRLVAAGYKVGVVRQTETAAIKAAAGGAGGAPFARDLSAVYTRATIEAAAGELEGGGAAPVEGSSYLVCVVDKEVEAAGREGLQVKVGMVAIEVSTGEVVHREDYDGICGTHL